MMYKKIYQEFASEIALLKNDEERERIISFCIRIFKNDNSRFSEGVFREWIRREINGEDLK